MVTINFQGRIINKGGDDLRYKFDGEISEITVTQTALAKWLGCSQQRVSQMTANGEGRQARILLLRSLREYRKFVSPDKRGKLDSRLMEMGYWELL